MRSAIDASGKIERRFDTFQKRLVTLLADERITNFKAANQLLQHQLDWHNQHHVCHTTGRTPNAAWAKALAGKRSRRLPVPAPPLLDLHLALYRQRRFNADGPLDFLGQNWPVTPLRQKTVTLVHHPDQCSWVIPQTPDPKHPVWPTVLAHHRR